MNSPFPGSPTLSPNERCRQPCGPCCRFRDQLPLSAYDEWGWCSNAASKFGGRPVREGTECRDFACAGASAPDGPSPLIVVRAAAPIGVGIRPPDLRALDDPAADPPLLSNPFKPRTV